MTNTIHQPHDKLFKLSMTELPVAIEFFQTHLPKHILENIDLSSLSLENHSFINPAYKSTEADLVYSVKVSDKTAYLYLLCEHQTKVDPNLAFRILVYTVHLMETHQKQYPNDPLPMVYPTVVYTGEEPWTAPLDIFPLFGEASDLAKEILFKPYQLLDVNRRGDDELRQQALFGLVAFAFKHRKTVDFAQFLKRLIPWIHEVETSNPSGASLSRLVLRYIIDGSPQGDKDLLVQTAQQHLSDTLRGDIMTIAQQWEQEGIKKGMQQGIQEGEASLLKHLLQSRFGNLPLSYEQRINQADARTLLVWGGKVLEAKTLDDIFAD